MIYDRNQDRNGEFLNVFWIKANMGENAKYKNTKIYLY